MFIVALEQQNPRKNSNVIIVEKTIALVYLYNGHSNETTALCINMDDFAKQVTKEYM